MLRHKEAKQLLKAIASKWWARLDLRLVPGPELMSVYCGPRLRGEGQCWTWQVGGVLGHLGGPEAQEGCMFWRHRHRDMGDAALAEVIKGTVHGSATEEELGRVTECGKSRVPPARVPWESAQPGVRSTPAAGPEARFGES